MMKYSWILLACCSMQSWANQLEVIQLQNRSADEVLPVLRPLLEQGGTLTGINDQLILRASDRNRAEIHKVLATIDRAPRQLVIYVRQDMTQNRERQGISANGRVMLGNGVELNQSGNYNSGNARHGYAQPGVDINLQNRQGQSRDNANQMVRVIDGGSAYISAGVSVPIPMRSVYYGPSGTVMSESTVYQDLTSGFYATPRLMGDRVTIDISPQQSNPVQSIYGAQNIQRLYTTVQSRLGEWVQIGGANANQTQQNRQLLGRDNQYSDTRRGVWLKVEAE